MISNNILEKYCNCFRYKFYKDFEYVLSNSPKEEREDIYNLAIAIMKKVPSTDETRLEQHYRKLLNTYDYDEYIHYSLFHILKKKHRASFDKYYIFGLQLYKIIYTDNGKLMSIFGIIKINLD